VVRSFASEADKFQFILTVNVCRRKQLNRHQKRKVVQAYLIRDSEIADNSLAELIGGMSHNSVRAIRLMMISKNEIPRHDKLRGKDGKHRPAKIKRVIANTEKEIVKAVESLHFLPDRSAGRILDVTTATRHAKRERGRLVREALADQQEPTDPTEDIALYHCPFQQLEARAGLHPEGTNLICTDIPYIESFVTSGQVGQLARFAKRLLVPGGVLVTYSGVMFLNQVMKELDAHLDFYWCGPAYWTSEGNIVESRLVANHWKAILIYTKGPWLPRFVWNDLFHFESKEKKWHPWQQPIEEAEKLIEIFSRPGDLCCDPCGGGFTVALACQKLGRRFVGCDIEEECVKLGRVRLQEEAEWGQQWIHPFVIPMVRPLSEEEQGVAV